MTEAEKIAAARFWAKVERRADEECWPWTGAKNSRGYGNIMWAGRRGVKATHVSLELAGSPRPSSEALALHGCDNPPCVNPRHLRWGTGSENAKDAVARGRAISGWQRRETHCKRGHPYGPARQANGRRICSICQRTNHTEWQRRKRAEVRKDHPHDPEGKCHD